MRAVMLAFTALLLAQTAAYEHADEVDASPEIFQYQRTLSVPVAAATGQACALVDAAMEEHTAGRMQALRLYRVSAGNVAGEVPFALTESGEAGQPWEVARVVNLGERHGAIVFALMMPQRTYSEVDLDLVGKDFLASAKVTGIAAAGRRTELGKQTLFDLQSQGLGRSTRLMLQEVNFPTLSVELHVTAAPHAAAGAFTQGMVRGAEVPPSREEQTLYTDIAETANVMQQAHDSVASLKVGAHVPVERVAFTLQPGFMKNFSRVVTVSAKVSGDVQTETVTGEIERVKLPGVGDGIDREQMSMEAMLGANLRDAAEVRVAVANGDDAPLSIAAIMLQMRQRKLCFNAEQGAHYVLRYGSTQPVRAPVFDYAKMFRAATAPALASVGAEELNPAFREPPKLTSYTERHKWVLWVALLAAIVALSWIALGNARRV